jgi:hypothetical protein
LTLCSYDLQCLFTYIHACIHGMAQGVLYYSLTAGAVTVADVTK